MRLIATIHYALTTALGRGFRNLVTAVVIILGIHYVVVKELLSSVKVYVMGWGAGICALFALGSLAKKSPIAQAWVNDWDKTMSSLKAI